MAQRAIKACSDALASPAAAPDGGAVEEGGRLVLALLPLGDPPQLSSADEGQPSGQLATFLLQARPPRAHVCQPPYSSAFRPAQLSCLCCGAWLRGAANELLWAAQHWVLPLQHAPPTGPWLAAPLQARQLAVTRILAALHQLRLRSRLYAQHLQDIEAFLHAADADK